MRTEHLFLFDSLIPSSTLHWRREVCLWPVDAGQAPKRREHRADQAAWEPVSISMGRSLLATFLPRFATNADCIALRAQSANVLPRKEDRWI